MRIKAKLDVAARPAKLATPALAAVLAGAAAAAGIPQPQAMAVRPAGFQQLPAAPLARPAAVVRVLLPEPALKAEAGRPSRISRKAALVAPRAEALDPPAPARLAMPLDTPATRPGPAAVPVPASSAPEKDEARLAPMQNVLDAAPAAALPIPAVEPAPQFVPTATASSAAASRSGIGRYRMTGRGISFDLPALVNGAPVGRVSLLIRDNRDISVRLSDLLAALQPMIEPAVYDQLAAAEAARSHVTLNELRAAGIPVRFDDDDRLVIGRR